MHLCSNSLCDRQLLCGQHSKRPHVWLQRWLLRQRPQLLSLQDMHSSKLSLSETLHSWEQQRHSRLLLQRWILWKWNNVLSMQDVLAVRHDSQPLLRQHQHRHVNVLV